MPRGFAGMTPEQRHAAASKGGRNAHKKGVAHVWTPEEARRASQRGGQAVSQDRRHMAEIGRKGAIERHRKLGKKL